MQQFIHYENISDWVEDDIILVDFIDGDTANVRTHLQELIRGPLPIKEAIADAQRFNFNVIGMKGIGAYLREGVEWSPEWGDLIKSS